MRTIILIVIAAGAIALTGCAGGSNSPASPTNAPATTSAPSESVAPSPDSSTAAAQAALDADWDSRDQAWRVQTCQHVKDVGADAVAAESFQSVDGGEASAMLPGVTQEVLAESLRTHCASL